MKDATTRILFIEDSPLDVELILRVLGKSGMVVFAKRVMEALSLREMLSQEWDVVLSDFHIPGFGAFEALKIVREIHPETPFVVVSGAVGEETAVEIMRAGATDFVTKGNLPRLVPVIQRELRENREREARLRAESALQIAEERYELAMNAARVGAWELNLANRQITLSPMAAELFATEELNAPMEKLFQQIDEADRGQVMQAIERTIAEGIDYVAEFRVRGQDGRPRWLASRGSRLNFPDRLVGVHLDITSTKNAQEESRLAQLEAEKANRAKSEFLANMSHEIRTPLNAILGFSDLLAEPAITDEEKTAYAKRVRVNGEHLIGLIDGILDLSKVESGRVQIERIYFSFGELIAELLNSLRETARKKSLELAVEFLTPIPKNINSDPTRLRQVLSNILDNAIKFTEAGKITVRVGMDHEATEGELRIEIEDTGIGIATEHQASLFRPFSQADSSITRRFGGTGIGLDLSRRLMSLLGGRITLVWSEVSRGSLFRIQIPTGVAARDLSTRFDLVPGTTSDANPTDLVGEGLRILLAEDSLDNEALVRLYLERAGLSVEVVRDGREAVHQALHGQHDLVLMDLQMPVMDGLEATRQLRKQGYVKPIVALTAHALGDEVDRSLRAGCNYHLSKPVDRRKLLKTIADFVRS